LRKSSEIYRIALSKLNGIGPIRAAQVLSKLENINDLFESTLQELKLQTGMAESLLRALKREDALALAEKQLIFNEKHSITTHFFQDSTYPRRLRQCSDAPIVIYTKGEMDLNHTQIVSIVGTRNHTEYGKELLKSLIRSFKNKNILVVSGLAYGVDIHAHQLCLENKIQTIGILGHGLDRIYPSQHKQIAKVMQENGGLVTEFMIGTNPDRENFPMRNRIVAGLADATIVIESKERGGSMITAELANDYSRDVFAFPGDIGRETSEGCNLLIKKQKAHLISSPNDFLTFMNWDTKTVPVQKKLELNLEPDEATVINLFENEEILNLDTIGMKAEMSASKINVLLFQMEIKNIVEQLPGKRYRILKK
jgi:DNA processing protein